jgi:hypothetical protein
VLASLGLQQALGATNKPLTRPRTPTHRPGSPNKLAANERALVGAYLNATASQAAAALSAPGSRQARGRGAGREGRKGVARCPADWPRRRQPRRPAPAPRPRNALPALPTPPARPAPAVPSGRRRRRVAQGRRRLAAGAYPQPRRPHGDAGRGADCFQLHCLAARVSERASALARALNFTRPSRLLGARRRPRRAAASPAARANAQSLRPAPKPTAAHFQSNRRAQRMRMARRAPAAYAPPLAPARSAHILEGPASPLLPAPDHSPLPPCSWVQRCPSKSPASTDNSPLRPSERPAFPHTARASLRPPCPTSFARALLAVKARAPADGRRRRRPCCGTGRHHRQPASQRVGARPTPSARLVRAAACAGARPYSGLLPSVKDRLGFLSLSYTVHGCCRKSAGGRPGGGGPGRRRRRGGGGAGARHWDARRARPARRRAHARRRRRGGMGIGGGERSGKKYMGFGAGLRGHRGRRASAPRRSGPRSAGPCGGAGRRAGQGRGRARPRRNSRLGRRVGCAGGTLGQWVDWQRTGNRSKGLDNRVRERGARRAGRTGPAPGRARACTRRWAWP